MLINKPWHREEEGGGDVKPTGGTGTQSSDNGSNGGTGDTGGSGGITGSSANSGLDGQARNVATQNSGTGTKYFEAVPEDWREQIAGEDESRLNILKRYTDFPTFVQGGFEARERIRKGEISTGLPDDPSDDQLTAWRDANDVPATADGYEVQLDQGFVMGEEDEFMMDGLRPIFHEHNLPAKAVNALTNAWMKTRQQAVEQIQLRDTEERTNAIRDLKEVWGGEFQGNQNRVQGVLARMPEEVRDAIESARSHNGTGSLIFNIPGLLQFFESEERDRNPAGTVVPGSHNPAGAIDDRIATIEKTMRDDPDSYWKDQKMQDEFGQLLDAKQRMAEQSK